MADELGRKVSAALSFSGRPIILLCDPAVIGKTDEVLDGSLSGFALVTVEAALRPNGKRYVGRFLMVGLAHDVDDVVFDGRPLFLMATRVYEHPRYGEIIEAYGGFAPVGSEAEAMLAQFREMTSDQGGSAIYAEIAG